MKKGFWKVVQSMEIEESVTRKSAWKTKKQMDLKYTESEIEEMIENGSVQALVSSAPLSV
eukprot:3970443-Pyramimonas_sp.AAC.1